MQCDHLIPWPVARRRGRWQIEDRNGQTVGVCVWRSSSHTKHCHPPIQSTARAGSVEAMADRTSPAARNIYYNFNSERSSKLVRGRRPGLDKSLPPSHTNHCHAPIQITTTVCSSYCAPQRVPHTMLYGVPHCARCVWVLANLGGLTGACISGCVRSMCRTR